MKKLNQISKSLEKTALTVLACAVPYFGNVTETKAQTLDPYTNEITSLSIEPMTFPKDLTKTNYFENIFTNRNWDGSIYSTEHKIYLNDSNTQWLSVIEKSGAVAIRPHPGDDLNGWGLTPYYDPSTTNGIMSNSYPAQVFFTNNLVKIITGGLVTDTPTNTLGTWSNEMDFMFNQLTKTIYGTGVYTIHLDKSPLELQKEITIIKVADNLMTNYPTLLGTNGTCGDMGEVRTSRNNSWTTINYNWDPVTTNATYPQDKCNLISISIGGNLNTADTRSSTQHAIKLAYKPSLELTVSSSNYEYNMCLGLQWTPNKSANAFKEDNAAPAIIIPKTIDSTSYQFNTTYASSALADEGKGKYVHIKATAKGTSIPDKLEVYQVDKFDRFPRDIFRNYLGDINRIPNSDNFEGKVPLIFSEVSDGANNYLILRGKR